MVEPHSLEWLQQIVLVSKFLGNLLYKIRSYHMYMYMYVVLQITLYSDKLLVVESFQ